MDRKQLHKTIADYLIGKTISSLRFDDPEHSDTDTGIELVFSDGTEIEIDAFCTDEEGDIIDGRAELVFCFEED